MIFECIQTERLPITRHDFVQSGQVIGKATATQKGVSDMIFGTEHFIVQFQSFQKISILQNNSEVGSICPKLCVTKKILFLKTGYEYHELTLNGETVTVFESGLGANKHFYSIYRGDTVIAVIHKPDKVVNHLDRYVCYVDRKEDAVITALYCMFLESGEYYNLDATGNVVDSTATVTAQKELIEKYDPGFIEKIIARDGEN